MEENKMEILSVKELNAVAEMSEEECEIESDIASCEYEINLLEDRYKVAVKNMDFHTAFKCKDDISVLEKSLAESKRKKSGEKAPAAIVYESAEYINWLKRKKGE